MRRLALLTAAATVLLPVGGGLAQDPTPGAAASGPNVVVVMTDDQRVDDMPALPNTQRLIGEAGVTFTHYFASYPVCCPARATFLTGQYAHNHKVRCLYPSCGGGYGALNQRQYLPVWLERRRLRDGAHRQVPEWLRQGAGARCPERLDRVVRAR